MSLRVSHNAPALLALAALSLAACGGGDGGGGSAAAPTAGGASAGSATLSWLPPTENVDGSTVSSLAGYFIYSGTNRSSMRLVKSIPSPGITVAVIDGLNPGTHHFAVSAFTTSGTESELTSVISKTIR